MREWGCVAFCIMQPACWEMPQKCVGAQQVNCALLLPPPPPTPCQPWVIHKRKTEKLIFNSMKIKPNPLYFWVDEFLLCSKPQTLSGWAQQTFVCLAHEPAKSALFWSQLGSPGLAELGWTPGLRSFAGLFHVVPFLDPDERTISTWGILFWQRVEPFKPPSQNRQTHLKTVSCQLILHWLRQVHQQWGWGVGYTLLALVSWSRVEFDQWFIVWVLEPSASCGRIAKWGWPRKL